MFEFLRSERRPACGFLLHSYGGPVEMVAPLAALGAYFSFPGYYLHARKTRQRETFKRVPADRLLLETDAPDQPLPDQWVRYPLMDDNRGKPVNHPANLGVIYEKVAEWLDEPVESLALRIEANFRRLFAPALRNAYRVSSP
jgi:TatD DNase family protein